MSLLLFLLLFFCLQAFVLFCCLVASEDESSQKMSDLEQIEYLRHWMEQKQIK